MQETSRIDRTLQFMKGQLKVATPEAYIEALDEPRKSDIQKLHTLICETVPDLKPHIMNGMIAYGTFHYKYASGREGDWSKIMLASNKNYISLYACAVVDGHYVADAYRERLPKANIGKSCVRFKRLDDLDLEVVKELLKTTAVSSFGI